MILLYKSSVLVFCLLIIVSFPAIKSLFVPGGFTSHDLTHHVVRQVQMDQILTEGQFPPRWAGNLSNGFGYPVFLFNYPLPYLIGEIFHLSGLDFVESIKGVLLLSMLGSIVAMYLFLQELLGSSHKKAAFLGAVFYLYAPIRFSIVYVSASVGSALALAFVPLIFWAVLKVIKEGRLIFILIGALAFASLITAHNVTALMFAPIMLIFSLISLKIYSTQFTLRLLLMYVWGLSLSAFFWLPAIWEKQYVVYDSVLSKYWVDHFPTFQQLIYSPWGYGLSHPGIDQDAMSFQIGIAQILVIVILIILMIFKGSQHQLKIWGLFSLIVFVLCVFFMLDGSKVVWENLPLVGYIQFPFRILTVVVFICALAAALVVRFTAFSNIAFVVLLLLVIYANRNHLNVNQKFDPGDDYYLSLKTTSSTFGEHLPKWANRELKSAVEKFELVDSSGEINVHKNTSNKVVAALDLSAPTKVKLNQYYFPGWEIMVDGKVVKINYLETGENYGLPVFNVASGNHMIEANFKNTYVRTFADGISFVSIALWFVVLSLIAFMKKHATIK